MLKYLAFLTKKQGMETLDFIDYYENKHLPLIRTLAPIPLVYRRRFLTRGDQLNKDDGALDFDVVTELGFTDRAAYISWRSQVYGPVHGEQVIADEAKFLDRSRTRSCVVEEYVTSE